MTEVNKVALMAPVFGRGTRVELYMSAAEKIEYVEGPDDVDDEDTRPLTDEELWFPQTETFDDFLDTDAKQLVLTGVPTILPSQFTEFAFRMPREDGQGYEKFTFKGRRHMIRPYDSPAKRMLLVCARQVEKSTMLGNRAITYSCLLSGFRTLYVSPSATQTKTFSGDRIKDPLETSEVLRSFTLSSLQQNIFEKQFINRSKITLRYAFLNPDRTRGIPAKDLLLDVLGCSVLLIQCAGGRHCESRAELV
jgi:hypothetical protein